ncbi:archaetidylserine decarboxylase [Fodinisporobacter ferrooxydans]|uniref:Phosphatidylserine decarboxylase proenzyme n=1 Tax=Fodinisporobacter ferrooxydans TaxID=2901836 RepID=A0ABY4CFS9_9BACL|nr:archaetidylserine decarboxylase [Alicyclobacillaceae bacterium MYW30-H2]
MGKPAWSDRIKFMAVRVLPKHLLSRLAGTFARSSFSRVFIPLYIKAFQIDLTQIEKKPHEYQSLTEFFTRRLLPDVRPIDPHAHSIVSPVDGTVAQFGVIRDGKLIQAKGVTYTVAELLADVQKQNVYEGGWFITIYLSPTDYHRIHMPVAGTPSMYTYVPGSLYPVNPLGVKYVPGLFAKNERIITYFKGPYGEFALVKVGATIVGSVVVEYGNARTNVKRGQLIHCELPSAVEYGKGQECGRFEFGSTVILLFPRGVLVPEPGLFSGQTLRMGQRIGELVR